MTGRDNDQPATRFRWWAGPAAAVIVAAIWVALARVNLTTTHPFAPVVAAAAWPVLDRVWACRPVKLTAAVAASAGGAAIALVAVVVLACTATLRGPALLGVAVPAEAIAGAVAGGVLGLVLAVSFRARGRNGDSRRRVNDSARRP